LSARLKLENNYNSISRAELSALNAENLDNEELMIEQEVEIIENEEPAIEGEPDAV